MAPTPIRDFNSLSAGQLAGNAQQSYLLQEKTADTLLGQRWLAKDLRSPNKSEVSLEFIRPELSRQSSALDCIKQHVANGKKLRHKHLTRSLSFVSSDPQPAFIVSEKLDANSLASLLQNGQTKKLTVSQLKGMFLQIASALDTAYSQFHMGHNGLCPALITINRGQGVKLGGYGLSPLQKLLPKDLPRGFRSDIYLAPEVHQGQAPKRSADIYAFACIIYETLTGHPPFATTASAAQCDPLRLSAPKQLSEQQWERLQNAMSVAPDARPANALTLVKELFRPDEEVPAEETPAEEAPDTDTQQDDGDKAKETASKDRTLPGRLSAEDLSPEPPATSTSARRDSGRGAASTSGKTNTDRAQKLKRPLMFGSTFVAGVVLGYLLSLFVPSLLPATAAQELTDKQADINNTANPAALEQDKSPDSITPPGEPDQNLQAKSSDKLPAPAAAESLITPDSAEAAVQFAAQLTAEQHPRALLFRDQIDSKRFGPDMVALPAGTFDMGDSHRRGDDNEKPVHPVTLPRAFALSRYEVTFAQYDLFARKTGRALPDDEGWGRGNRPVINVSWKDADAYSQWLAKKTGQPYRLPTEAEWEYAARAGTNTAFSWGNEPLPGYAVCDLCGTEWDGKQSAPVGSLQANRWGLYDMAGNVSEWVQDCYYPDYTNAPADGRPRLDGNCDHRVMRGGSWFDISRLIRPAGRYRHPSGAQQNDWGFRVALDLPENFIKENNP